MAYLRRYRRSYRRPIRRTSRFNRYSKRFSRNMLAAFQQRDVGRFTIKIRQQLNIQIPAGQKFGYGTVFAWGLLGSDPQFTALKSLFDQVKINGVRVSAASCVQPEFSSTVLPTFVYAWDRNGVENLGSGDDMYSSVASYGSSRMQTIGSGIRNSFTTSIVAQDIQERSIYTSTAVMSEFTDDYSSLNMFFKPTLIVAVQQPGTVGVDNTYRWELDVAVDVTFRGTRYSSGRQ